MVKNKSNLEKLFEYLSYWPVKIGDNELMKCYTKVFGNATKNKWK